MKARVKTHLNERTQKPSVNAPSYHYYSPGDEIEIVEIVNGDNYEGIDVWYKLDNDSFVWSGGVEGMISLENLIVSGTVSKSISSWGIEKLDIPVIWEQYEATGKDINVAILDTGISNHRDFSKRIIYKDFYGNSDTPLDEDDANHGTSCAGIIGSSSNSNYGLAPEANLHIFRVMKFRLFPKKDILNKSLEWIVQNGQNIDIISISIFFIDEDPITKQLIYELIQKDKIIVSSVGNSSKLGNFFPASYPEVLSIGAIDRDLKKIEKSAPSDHISLLAPGFELPTTKTRTGTGSFSGTSAATAYVAGVFALILSYTKKNNIKISNQEIKKFVIENTDRYGRSKFSIESGYGIINPLKVIETIKTNT